MPISQNVIKQGWKEYISNQPITVPIRQEVQEAWGRCKALGADPMTVAPVRLSNPQEIQQRLQRNQELLSVSTPAIDHLYQFLQDASLFAVISDADGYLLSVYGETNLIDPSHNILYSLWDEATMGNNPIGTALHNKRPTQVFGYEHFCRFPHRFSGAGTPIHGTDGQVIGAISITHVTENPHPHTLAVVVMTAYAIEHQLQQLEASRSTQVAYQHLRLVVDTISEGLMVLAPDGTISMVNPALLQLFQVTQGQLLSHAIWEFLQDALLKQAIEGFAPLSDFVTKFKIGGREIPCAVTHRMTPVDNGYESVLIVTELSRIHRLAAKLSSNQTPHTFDSIVFEENTPLLEEARIIASHDSNILLLGESGTGKDVFAQAIHNASPRRNGPFIPINCGAVQKELISSELFGYDEGAFTGARRGGSVGKLEFANGGTIFLDEIGEMPLDLQPILLRAIEQQVITRVGGKQFIPINVRIIAATNRNLQEAVRLGSFRQDLYYRLNVFTLTLPPLRQRTQDIPALVHSFLSRLNLKYGKAITEISPQALSTLEGYHWPGNIRELQNTVERCVALSKGHTIELSVLPPHMTGEQLGVPAVSQPTIAQAVPTSPQDPKEQLLTLLNHHHWNITAVSQTLGVTRATVYRRMKRYQLEK